MKINLCLATILTFAGVTSAWSQAASPLGCYKDQGDPQGTGGRDLSGFMTSAPNMTGAQCIATCKANGYAYAGTQYGNYCFCGNAYGRTGLANNCNVPCGGSGREICGGAWANTVYPTAIATARNKFDRPPAAALEALAAPLPKTWDALLAQSWQTARRFYRIEAAPTTRKDPICRSNLALDTLSRNTTIAISIHKYGDAARFMSQFQDRSLCLTREGARGVEFALGSYLHHALKTLPPQQAQIATQGVLNLGMLVFDELQYTRRSWWMPTIHYHLPRIKQFMANYPRQDLGLWLYDSKRGLMQRSADPFAVDRLLDSMHRFENFGHGRCPLADMMRTGFICREALGAAGGTASPEQKTGGATATGPGGLATLPPSDAQAGVSCMLESVQASGPRGQLACVNKAMSGFTVDPRTAWKAMLLEANQQPGIRDKSCALGEEAQGDDSGGDGDAGGEGAKGGNDASGGKEGATADSGKTNEPSAWDNFTAAVSIIVSAVVSVFDKTPEPIGTVGQAASPQGADAERGGMQMIQEFQTRNSAELGTEKGNELYEMQRDNRVVTDPQAFSDKGRPAGGDTLGGGGPCGARSNAAARAQSLFQCIAGVDRVGAQATSGPLPAGDGKVGDIGTSGSTHTNNAAKELTGGFQRPLDPNLIHTDPSADPEPGSAMSGPMACVVQGGDLVRGAPNDPRCARVHCAPGQECTCDRSQLVQGQPQLQRDPKSTPDCVEGGCEQPGTGGSGTPPPAPNFGGPPVPPPH